MDVSIGADRVGIRVHFFTRETTNTFLLERSGSTLNARVEGRSESANVGDHAGGRENAIRNRAACEGAGGLQQHQWNRFTENLTRP